MRIFAILLFAMLVAGFGWTQPAPSVQEAAPTLRITVTLVQVDAVVTDSRGRRVTNLTPDDFEILQDGVPQRIKLFSYTPEAPPQETSAPLGPALPISAGQVRRTIALVVDDLALSFENLVRTREALRRYIEKPMLPGDLVAIVRTGGGIVALEQFTGDRRMLLASVNSLRWRFRGRCGIIPVRERQDPGGSGKPEVLDYGCALSALGALGSIDHVIRGMRDLPGRKSVVLISDNLRLDERVHRAIDQLTDLANRSAVTLYAIDPGGLKTNIPDAATAPSESGTMLGDLISLKSEEAAQATDALGFLARRTGGIFFGDNNDIPACIRAAAEDQLGYYLLGYTPPEGTFEQEDGAARFRKIVVRVKRPGLRVRWKSGFNGVPDQLMLTGIEQKAREQQLSEALASPFLAKGVRVHLTSMFMHFGKEGPGVRSLLHFDARDLTFRRHRGGERRSEVDIVISAYRGMNQRFVQGERLEVIRLPDDVYQRALRRGFLLVLDDLIKETGPFILRTVVRDRSSGRIGSASQFLEIPDLRKERLAMSGILLRLADPEVLKSLLMKPELATVDGNGEPWADGGPATPRYKPGHNLVYSFLVVNWGTKGTPPTPNLTLQLMVFRDGKLVYSGEDNPVAAGGQLDDGRVVAAGVLKFGTGLQPGEYLLQINVTDRHVRKKHSRVSDWIDFEVTKQ